MEAIGLLASLAQITDCCSKIISIGTKACRATRGSLPQNRDAELLTENLQQSIQQVRQNRNVGNDIGLETLCEQGLIISDELLVKLNRIRERGRQPWYKLPLGTFKALWEQAEIESLQARLSEYRNAIFEKSVLMMQQSTFVSSAENTRMLKEIQFQLTSIYDLFAQHFGPDSEDESDEGSSDSDEEDRCFKCGKMGHWARDCNQRPGYCFNCHRYGHFQSTCWIRTSPRRWRPY